MQARAEATRRTILETAVELFERDGYANVALTDLLAATRVSKGAFYYHFSSRESVATAIIQETDAKLRDATLELFCEPSATALGSFIRSVFVVADLTRREALVRTGIQLRGGLGHISPAVEGFSEHMRLFAGAINNAITEGDLRADVDADSVAYTLWTAILGTHQQCAATGEDLHHRLACVLNVIIPGICTPDAARRYLGVVSEVCTPKP